jgi:hypothetical protein
MNDRIPDALCEFAALFNRGEFWESHEVLETPWRQARSGFLQGLILVASAWVHVRRGNPRGILAQLRKAERRLSPYRPAYQGVDVDALLAHAPRAHPDGSGPPRGGSRRRLDPGRPAAAAPAPPTGSSVTVVLM